MTQIKVYDNNGVSFDRYLIFIDNEAYTMSRNALSPQGVNQYLGKKHEIVIPKEDKLMSFNSLPNDVKEAIQQRISVNELNDVEQRLIETFIEDLEHIKNELQHQYPHIHNYLKDLYDFIDTRIGVYNEDV